MNIKEVLIFMNIETVLKMSVVICCKQQRFAIAEVFGLLNVGSICGRHCLRYFQSHEVRISPK